MASHHLPRHRRLLPDSSSNRLLKNYLDTLQNTGPEQIAHAIGTPRRMFKKAVQRGRSERRGEAYSLPYVEPLSDVRTKLADFFNILLRLLHCPYPIFDTEAWVQPPQTVTGRPLLVNGTGKSSPGSLHLHN
ncbi:MAG: hypothetical protein KatS3mg082_0427 [Nitrospiraceae bacterium]|nr:MAG: hypothetical protein KatS3mg082_0427 [Nitrospiraceae bacterium]